MESFARIGAGALAGIAATYAMDAVTEIFYTEWIKQRESDVSPQSAAAGAAMKLLGALGLEPTHADARKAAPLLHWVIGIGSGMIAGAIHQGRSSSVAGAVSVTTVGMMVFDEVGLSQAGVVPPSSKYPWQTSVRSVIGHATYGIVLGAVYAYLSEFTSRR